jgi:tRNA(Ile)-lysidine synthase
MKLTISAAMVSGIVRERGVPGQWPAACSLAPEAVGARPLLLRTRQPGDRIAPLGMQGTRRLQDIFVDAKLPRSDRDKLPLLCCGETVVWVPGYRVARDFAVRDATAPAIQIRITV